MRTVLDTLSGLQLANWLIIGGSILVVVGAAGLLVARRNP